VISDFPQLTRYLAVFDSTQSGACVANEVGIHPGGMLHLGRIWDHALRAIVLAYGLPFGGVGGSGRMLPLSLF
jgi:hypothetical protein